MSKIRTMDISKVFGLEGGTELKGFIGLTYGLDGTIFKTNILSQWNIHTRKEIRELDFFKIYVHFSNITSIDRLIYDRIKAYRPSKGSSFHPKIYIMKYAKNGSIYYKIVTGSFNLTHSGLNANHEYVVSKEFKEDPTRGIDNKINKFLRYICKSKDTPIRIANNRLNTYSIQYVFQDNRENIYEKIMRDKKYIKEIHLISPFWGKAEFIKRLVCDISGTISLYFNRGEDCQAASVEFRDLIEEKKIHIFVNRLSNTTTCFEEDIEKNAYRTIPFRLEEPRNEELFKILNNKIINYNKKEWLVDDEDMLREFIEKYAKKEDNENKSIDFENEVINNFRRNRDQLPSFEKRYQNHAKIIYIKYKNGKRKVFIGSSNITAKGLGVRFHKNVSYKLGLRNVECGVILNNPCFAIDNIIRKKLDQKNRGPLYKKFESDIDNDPPSSKKDNYFIDKIILAINIRRVRIKNCKIFVSVRIASEAKALLKKNLLFIEGTKIDSSVETYSFVISIQFAQRGLRIKIEDSEGRKYIRILPLPYSEKEVETIDSAVENVLIKSPDDLFDTNFDLDIKEGRVDGMDILKKANPFHRFPFQSLMKTLFFSEHKPLNDLQRFCDRLYNCYLKEKTRKNTFIEYYSLSNSSFRLILQFIKQNIINKTIKYKRNRVNEQIYKKIRNIVCKREFQCS